MVAGGGASVIYADTVTDAGYGKELANYGEYSGAPTTQQTYDYARTILSLMTRTVHPQGKVLLIGGGIANFTDIAATFDGIIRALTEYKSVLLSHKIKIFVRRAGPNWQEGLEKMRAAGVKLGIDLHVFGPELHMTTIVPMALGLPVNISKPRNVPEVPTSGKPTLVQATSTGNTSRSSSPAPTSTSSSTDQVEETKNVAPESGSTSSTSSSADLHSHPSSLFTPDTQAFVYGLQPGAVQNMLDFDFICGRKTPSVAALIYPFMPNHYQKCYWQTQEILIPCYQVSPLCAILISSLNSPFTPFPHSPDTYLILTTCLSI